MLLVIIGLMHFPASASAETVICVPDCYDDEFITQYPGQVEFVIGNCSFVADFYVRKACDTWCDILLWRVRCIDPPPCDNYDMNQVIDIAQAQIIMAIMNDEKIFAGKTKTWNDVVGEGTKCMPPSEEPGSCTTYWRVSKASCWKWFENSSYDPEEPPSKINYWGGISYCEYDICCLTYYKVCYDEFMQLVVTEVESNSTDDCPLDPSGECEPVCD